MHHGLVRILIFALSTFTIATAIAPPARAADEPSVDNRGALVRIAPGGGRGSMFGDNLNGFAADMSMAFGLFVAPTVALHITTAGSIVFDEFSDGYFFSGGFGITGYEMSNLYASVSFLVGAAKTSESAQDASAYGIEVLIGKEWIANDTVAGGLAVGFLGHRLNEEQTSNQTGGSITLRVSITVR